MRAWEVDEVRAGVTDDEVCTGGLVELQSPNLDRHPVPQYADDLPQTPYLEQQFPNIEPLQVKRFRDSGPQIPIGVTLRALTLRNKRAVAANCKVERIILENRRKRVTGLRYGWWWLGKHRWG